MTLVSKTGIAVDAVMLGDGHSNGLRALPVISRSEQAIIVELDRATSVLLVVPRADDTFPAASRDEGWRVPERPSRLLHERRTTNDDNFDLLMQVGKTS